MPGKIEISSEMPRNEKGDRLHLVSLSGFNGLAQFLAVVGLQALDLFDVGGFESARGSVLRNEEQKHPCGQNDDDSRPHQRRDPQ
jgi:hypothetical protein